MPEEPDGSIIPPRPALPPKALKRQLAREAREREKLADAEERRAIRQEKRELRNDASYFHGHQVVTGEYLGAVFTDDEPLENPVLFRHRIIHGVTLTLLTALVIAAVVFAVMVSRGDLQLQAPAAASEPGLSCPGASFDYPPNKNVHVQVYNSTRREGLAGTVAAALRKRGYKVGAVANKITDYRGTAVIVSGPAGQSAAFNLQRNVRDTEYVQDKRSDATVDIYLTSAFTGLVPPDRVDQTPGKLSCPRLSPTPVPSATGSPSAAPTTASRK